MTFPEKKQIQNWSPVHIFGCLTLVGQHPMKSLLFVCPSVCPSLTFLKIGSLVFSDIVHDDSWPWHLVTDEPDFCKKKIGSLNWVKWAKIRHKTRGLFCHFLQFGLLVFLEIAYSDSLEQCITSTRGKTHEKSFLELTLGQNRPKPGPKLVFFGSYRLVHTFFFKLHRMIAWNNA